MANLLAEDIVTLYIVELRSTNHYRYLVNFDIPVDIVRSARYAEELNRIRNFISLNFMPQPENCVSCTFQVTATYILRKPDLNEERQWTGSFFNTADNKTVLSGEGFRHFIHNSFINFVTNCTTEQNVLTTLNWEDVDTQYSFDQLTSIIISFQVIVKDSNTRFHRAYGFGVGNNTRHYKRRIQVHNW
jgi:hypothetical protein